MINWVNEVQSKGVGEIILTSIIKDGTGEGFDLELLDLVHDTIKVPLIIHGGAGNSKHISNILKYENVSGVAISSILHYSFIRSNKFKFDNKKKEIQVIYYLIIIIFRRDSKKLQFYKLKKS